MYRKKAASFINIVQALGIGLVSSLIFWQKIFDPKAVVISIVSLIVIEIAIGLRARFASSCPHCGFDPLLYVKDRNAACERVRLHLEARKNDPDVWLARRPPIRISGKNLTRNKKSKSTRELVV